MPSKSEAQRRYLAATFGIDWMRRHGFDNKGKLPARVRKKKTRKSPKRKTKGRKKR